MLILCVQCGSFLSRGGNKLARLALALGTKEAATHATAKANGNFVFATLNKEEQTPLPASPPSKKGEGVRRMAKRGGGEAGGGAAKKPRIAMAGASSIFKHL